MQLTLHQAWEALYATTQAIRLLDRDGHFQWSIEPDTARQLLNTGHYSAGGSRNRLKYLRENPLNVIRIGLKFAPRESRGFLRYPMPHTSGQALVAITPPGGTRMRLSAISRRYPALARPGCGMGGQ